MFGIMNVFVEDSQCFSTLLLTQMFFRIQDPKIEHFSKSVLVVKEHLQI